MVKVGLFVRVDVKPGGDEEMEARLRATLPAIEEETGTIAWFALRLGPSSYAIVDVFPDEAARQAHLEAGRVRLQRVGGVLAAPPTIVPTEVIAAKLPGAPGSKQRMNERTVLAFYDALVAKDFEAASKLIGERYVQHNPLIADGIAGLEAFVALLRKEFPSLKADIKRVFCDGDFVVAHLHGIRVPGQRGSAIVDIFRLEDGKIVEHWDVQQSIPEHAANANGMF